MPTITGTVQAPGYERIATIQVESFGYGLVVYPPPQLPLNPYMGFTFPVFEGVQFGTQLAGLGRKIFRDGVIVFPPYPGNTYGIIAIWSNNAVGKDWSLQY